MKGFIYTFAGLALLGAAQAQADDAQDICSRDVMCVHTVEHGKTVDFYVDNKQSAEITVTFHVDDPIAGSNVDLPYTQTFPGDKQTLAFTLTKRDALSGPVGYRFEWDWGSIHAHYNPNYLYTLPFAPGTTHLVSQGFHGEFSHTGDFEYSIDFAMPIGTPIYAARGGVVVGTCERYTKGGPIRANQNRVNYIMIKHSDGTIGEYAHLEHNGVRVQVGEHVHAGDFIGYSGNTGFTGGPHLHFFVYKAIDGSHRESFPIHFKGYADTTLVQGDRYERPPVMQVSAPTDDAGTTQQTAMVERAPG